MEPARSQSIEVELPDSWFSEEAASNEKITVRDAPLAAVRQPEAIGAGTVLSKFIVLRSIGIGGSARVYLAYDTRLSRKVALKLLKPAKDRQAQLARLMGEAQAIARVSHPSVVTVYDAGVVGGVPFLALEYVDGVTLATWSTGKSWREVLGAYLEAGAALGAAHAHGVTHRDFKPDNVLIGRDERAKVTDFGLAYAEPKKVSGITLPGLRTDPGQSSNTLQGTPRYMAPEQLRCDPLTPATDQFSFCVALYEALYGELPFEGETLRQRARNVLAGELRTPTHADRVPAALLEVLRRGLATSPQARFVTMNDLLLALTRAANQDPKPNHTLPIIAGVAALGCAFFAGALLF